MGRHISKEEKLAAIKGSGGLLGDIAKRAGVRQARTVAAWRDKDPDIKAAIDKEYLSVIDEAEGIVVNAMRAGDLRAATFLLRTLGKDRGYTYHVDDHNTMDAKTASVTIFKLPDNGRGDQVVSDLATDPNTIDANGKAKDHKDEDQSEAS